MNISEFLESVLARNDTEAAMKKAITATAKAFREWLESDDVRIIEKESGKDVTETTEITMLSEPGSFIENFLIPAMKSEGITYIKHQK